MSNVAPAFDGGYTVIVVGGGGGIGRATALHLAEVGVGVAVADRDLNAARSTVDAIGSDDRAIAVRADVADEGSVSAALAEILRWRPQVHALVNTAGIQGPLGHPSHEVDIADFEKVVRVNLTGALVLTRVVVPHMLAHGYGRVAHVASIAGKEGNPNMIAYSTSKAGLIGLVKAQGKEYAQTGVLVNGVAPAVIRTPFLDTQPAEVVRYMEEKIPMGRVGEVDELAALLQFMISPGCSFTTGFIFDASGGRATY
ncbi:SDR family NAD(P)-dependent oxidoreductase [Microbacterium sp.]|uniref:SDR family NAD(P)-dependent oxidoreductase n=1 Tax=Microbacterium sp. TaxID=51671 RepID=UPI003F70DE82